MKSFSQMAKEELYRAENRNSCCDVAEHAGMMLMGAAINQTSVRFVTENQAVLGRYVALCRKRNMEPIVHQTADGSVRYVSEITDTVTILQMLSDLSLIDPATGVIRHRISSKLIGRDCCRRAFIKGAFLGGGTVIDPRKNYNLELVTPYWGLCQDLKTLLEESGFAFKSVMRKSKYVLYVKNSESISDFLTYMGAYQSQMELLNIKIEKEIRNDFNRAANGETANLEKTINASVQQIRAIEQISRTIGLDNLPDDLREVAMLRLEHKDLSLTELGALLNPPLSKSGVNHRLKKMMKLIGL